MCPLLLLGETMSMKNFRGISHSECVNLAMNVVAEEREKGVEAGGHAVCEE